MPHKVNLLRGEPSDIGSVMAGPWRDIRVETVETDPRDFESIDSEFAVFVVSGQCRLASPDQDDIPLGQGGAFALPRGGRARVASQAGPTRLLVIEMTIGSRDAR